MIKGKSGTTLRQPILRALRLQPTGQQVNRKAVVDSVTGLSLVVEASTNASHCRFRSSRSAQTNLSVSVGAAQTPRRKIRHCLRRKQRQDKPALGSDGAYTPCCHCRRGHCRLNLLDRAGALQRRVRHSSRQASISAAGMLAMSRPRLVVHVSRD
jgi:hypothetical protein